MAKHLEISITAIVPDDQDELGHEAIVASKDGVNTVVDTLKNLGLTDVVYKRHLATRRPKVPTVSGEAAFRSAHAPDTDEEAA